MKILHVNCNYMHNKLHQTMLEHFEDENIEHSVFCPISNKSKITITPNDYVVAPKCFQKWNRYFFYYKQANIIKAINKNFVVRDYDCIHAYTLFTDGNVAYEMFKKYGTPYCVAIRSTDVNLFLKRIKYLRSRGVKILKNASAVFFLSETYRQYVLDTYVPAEIQEEIKEKSYVVPNGIDDFWLDNRNVERDINEIKQRLSEKKLNVAYVGIINKNKNLKTLVSALEILSKEGWDIELRVAGGIQDNKVFEEAQNFKGLHYLGKLGQQDLKKCYSDSDVFILPSHTETFGLVYAEAMSQGLPVVYSRGQGFDGQFEDGLVGYAVDSYDEMQIVDAIKKIVINYENISRNCTKYVEKFDWSKIAKTYSTIYGKII